MTNEGRFLDRYFLMAMLQAKKAGVTQPPARPLVGNHGSLAMLGTLCYHHGDDTYQRLLIEEKNDRVYGSSEWGFGHPL